MVESIFQTFFLLASFSIALIAVAIANFAVSASYLGRETRLTRSRMEKRKRRLSAKLKKLQEKEKQTQISDLEREINEAKRDMAKLNNRIFLLSWLGAVILPCSFFIISFLSSIFGMNLDNLTSNLQFQNILSLCFIAISSICLIAGFTLLLAVVGMIDSAARNIPLPKIVVTFPNDEETIKIKRNMKTTIVIEVANDGEANAEDLWFYVDMPPSFEILHVPHGIYTIETYTESDVYPTFNCVRLILGDIPFRSTDVVRIVLKAPDEKKAFKIPMSISEKTLGRVDYTLTIEVGD